MTDDDEIIEAMERAYNGAFSEAWCNGDATQHDAERIGFRAALDAVRADPTYARTAEMRAEIEQLRETLEETSRYWRNEHARLCNSLVGIRRAANVRRTEKDGERHQYYYHTADAALNNSNGYRAILSEDKP